MAEEEQEHDDGEQRADEHRVAHAGDRVAHERRLVVDGLEPHPRRQRAPQRLRDLGEAVGQREGVAADLARDVDERRGAPVAGDDADVVLGAGDDARHVAHAQPAADHDVRHVVGRVRLGGGDDQVLLVARGHAPDGHHGRRLLDGRGEVGVGHA